MESDLMKAINDIKNCIEANSTDDTELEKCFRLLKSELFVKRNQTIQLTNDLEEANLKVFELTRNLEQKTKIVEGNQTNVNVIMQKYNKLETEFNENKNVLRKLEFQTIMLNAENKSLKELYQKNAQEKIELTRKLDVMSNKHLCDSLFQEDLNAKHNAIKSSMTQLRSIMNKLEAEQSTVLKTAEDMKIAESNLQMLNFLKQQIDKLKKEKTHFEELYIKTNAKLETLESLLEPGKPISASSMITEVIYKKWKQAQADYVTRMNTNNELLESLSEQLSNERTLNRKLILENQTLTEKMEQDVIPNSQPEVIVKTEFSNSPIVISD